MLGIQQPNAIDNNVFDTHSNSYSVYSQATLIVPDGAKATYKSKSGWKNFTNIKETSEQNSLTIHVAKAGTLSHLITDMEKYEIEELNLSGEINGDDLSFICEMAGKNCHYWGWDIPSTTKGKLKILDMSGTKIEAGGCYYEDTSGSYWAEYKYYYLNDDNYIPSDVFSGCSFESIIIPNSVTSVGSGAFANCHNLTSIAVESGNTHYDSRDNCNAIIETNTNTIIAGCKSTIIPNSVTTIGQSAFSSCTDLTSIIIPNSVTTIGQNAFSSCTGLNSIIISNSVTTIGQGAFIYCTSLTSINIPNSVTNIGRVAFYGCSGLTSLIIPKSVTSIDENAFSGCSGLESISVESGNTKYDSRDNCNAIIETESNTLIEGFKITIIPNNVTSIGNSAFSGCSDLTSVTIPNSVMSIGEYAFRDCNGLTSITISSSMMNIGVNAFSGCFGLKSVNITDLEAWCKIVFESYSSNPLEYAHHLLLNGEEIKELVIPNSVTSIGSSAFSGCSELISVTIPNSVTTIGNKAFQYCSGLTSITIPNSVTSIGSSAFSGCSNLTTIASEIETPFSIYSFDNDIYSTATLYVPIGKKSNYKSTTGWKNFTHIAEASSELCYNYITKGKIAEVIQNPNGKYFGAIEIPEKVLYEGEEYAVTKVADNAFSSSYGLTSLEIPNSVTNIGSGSFAYCNSINSITIPNSVTNIGGSAFKNCSGLNSVTIPNSLTSIESYTFYGCSGLTSIEIPEKVKTIGFQAFEGCSGLSSITIPNNVTSIGTSAFYGCSKLASVTIGNGFKTIGGSAFGNCTKLTDVYCMAENVPSTSGSAFEGSYVEYTTLHVPASALNAYKTTTPWSGFKEVVPISGEQAMKCATPTISYVDGKIKFICETEGVEYVSELSTTDVGNRYTDEVELSGKIIVKVYATKSGLDNSDIATAELEVPFGLKGDLNKDGSVNVADHVELTKIIMGQ